jgi:DNA invertase Pin-like site-specific DNA recombinase
MKAAIYGRVSTADQNAESQLYDVRQLAAQRGFEVVEEYIDAGYSGARARRPALDRMMADARRGHFQAVLVWASDRLARSVKHFVEVIGELDHLGIAYISYRENIDTAGALGRAIMIIVAAIAELERSLIIERVRTGMRRARLEGRHIGRRPLDLDHVAIRRDRASGMSLGQLAKAYKISRTTIRRVLATVPKGVSPTAPQPQENRRPETAA